MKALIFDLDDTLYDQMTPFLEALSLYIKMDEQQGRDLYLSFRYYADIYFFDVIEKRMTLEESRIRRLQQALAEHGYYLKRECIKDIQSAYEVRQGQLSLAPFLQDFFACCREKGIQLGVITNGPINHQMQKICSLGLSEWIVSDYIVISEESGYAKPDCAIFREMEERLGLPPENILYIGDSYENDVEGAKAAGWQAVWFNHRKRKAPASLYQPDHELMSWSAFANYLEELGERWAQ